MWRRNWTTLSVWIDHKENNLWWSVSRQSQRNLWNYQVQYLNRIECFHWNGTNRVSFAGFFVLRCEKVCRTLRHCGRHECGVKCCPVARDPMDVDGIHICKLICGKKLPCGRHKCQAYCHKGRCGRCLEAILEDLSCPCGKTVLEAPLPCGTPPPRCNYPCTKPYPCGHPPPPHTCHSGDCPPCYVRIIHTHKHTHTHTTSLNKMTV